MELHLKFSIIVALFAIFAFSSCERILVKEDNEVDFAQTDYGNRTAMLNVITRAGNTSDDENIISEGRIYIFNSESKCIQMLSTDGETNQVTTQISAGSYTLYAVGGNDLSRFSLPTKEEAIPTSIIKCLDGKVMDDFLMVRSDVELEDGETLNHNLVLERQVLCLDEIEIRQVPKTATKVEVSLTSFYGYVQLNGEFLSSPTESYKIVLTKQDDEKTWKATPKQMLFPSNGNPTIKISITTDNGVMAYSYNATEELPANHHFTIIGTYKATQGVTLTGILTAGGWGEDRTITFDIEDDNQDVYFPMAGEFFNDYYIVTVDEASHTAVLLSQSEIDYEAPINDSPQDLWLQAFVAPMAALDKPFGIQCGNWRLPTLNEAEIITGDPQAIYYAKNGNSINIFCFDGDVLNWAQTRKDEGFKHGSTKLSTSVYLIPVIDIHY